MARTSPWVPGLAVSFSIALFSQAASGLHSSFHPHLLSLIGGILVANVVADTGILTHGIKKVWTWILPLGIGLYGADLSIQGLAAPVWPAVLASALALFSVTYALARWSGLDRGISALLSSGMSICGASAIIIVSALIGAKKEDVSISVISVLTIGIIGMLSFRLLPVFSGLDTEKFAFLAGSLLPTLGLVKTVGAISGPECVELATDYKLLRVFLILFLSIAIMAVRDKRDFYKMPWFMAVFFGLAIISNTVDMGEALRTTFTETSGFLLSMGLASIGLSVNFDSITELGPRPFFAALGSWALITLFSFLIVTSFS